MMPANDVSVSIIIVNYNGKHFLGNCLSSVLEQTDPTCEVIVVDNASSDGSGEYLRETFPSVRCITSSINRGFAGGNNLGVKASRGMNIILLNNDTVVKPGWLKGLLTALNDPAVVSASSLIKTEGIPERYYEKNGSINFLGHNIMRVFEEPSDIFFAGGASMIFRKDILGLPFDEEYFVYGEDVYLGLRSRFMGYQVKHTNDSRLEHFGSGTSKKEKSAFLTYYQERNRILNTLIFFSPMTILKVFPFLFVNCCAKVAAGLFGNKYSVNGLIHAYGWLAFHVPLIRKKRIHLRNERKVDDDAVIRYMTGKLTNGESFAGKLINSISIFYCRIVRLRVIELTQ